MKITFTWPVQVGPSLSKSSAEETIKNSVEARPEEFKSCHEGTLLVSFLSTDPLEISLGGNISCHCGKEFQKFSLGTFSGTLELMSA